MEELVDRVKHPHNLVSYYLKRLRLNRLASERRSSADGRDNYYSLNLEQFLQLYLQTGQFLHPAIGDTSSQPYAKTETSKKETIRILFLCTHNSALSQMVEGFLRKNAVVKDKSLSPEVNQLRFTHSQLK